MQFIKENRERSIYNWLQYFTQSTLKQEFERNGLQIVTFYEKVAADPFDDGSQEFAVEGRINKYLKSMEVTDD